jgi:hypothetical protein
MVFTGHLPIHLARRLIVISPLHNGLFEVSMVKSISGSEAPQHDLGLNVVND